MVVGRGLAPLVVSLNTDLVSRSAFHSVALLTKPPLLRPSLSHLRGVWFQGVNVRLSRFLAIFVRCFCYLDNAKIQPLWLLAITLVRFLNITTSFRSVLNRVVLYN